MSLEAFLSFLVSSPGASAAAYWIIKKVPWFWSLSEANLRLVAFALSAVIAMAAWGASVGLGFTPAPAEWLDWVMQLWLIGTSAFGLATLIHTNELETTPR